MARLLPTTGVNLGDCWEKRPLGRFQRALSESKITQWSGGHRGSAGGWAVAMAKAVALPAA